ncbi:MAG TPA: beta galactosidase jelly roll domain-containing protein, partial [Sphingomonas sp.]|nr:beta galactosidase jelly roll domain-containing protein [Sphingomonas sp.]
MIGFRLAALLFLPAMMPAPLAIAQTAPNTASTAVETSRRTTPIDAGWRFLRGDPAGAAEPGFDDSGWTPTTLPHTYNGADGDDGDGYYRGPGWYRRSIALAVVPRGRRVYLQFDGAALATDVYVNGAHVGRHEGGHARFRFDVTGALREGDNLISVRVDNS